MTVTSPMPSAASDDHFFSPPNHEPLPQKLRFVTIADQIRETRGRSSGFDYLRIFLAVSIAGFHVFYLANGEVINFTIKNGDLPGPIKLGLDWIVWAFSASLVPMFFALSGFLVAGSLERCKTLRAFIGLRILRIFPALVAEVILSALLVGSIFTNRPLGDYFSDPLFARYFWNLVGEPQFLLPGVFDRASDHAVNGQLWTIPYELLCYIAIAALAVAGLRRVRIIAPATTMALIALVFARQFYLHGNAGLQYFPIGFRLLCSFLAGVSIYCVRDKLIYSRNVAVGAALVNAIALNYSDYGWELIVASIAGAYLTAYLGLANPRRLFFIAGADYSYGIYLYHWVLLQSTLSTLGRSWWIGALIGLPLTLLVAAASWHALEFPVSRLRAPLMKSDAAGHGFPLQISLLFGLTLAAAWILYHVH